GDLLEQPALVGAEQAQEVGAAALHEAQIVGVIDDAGEIGVLVVDAHRHDVAAVADLAVERRPGLPPARRPVLGKASGSTGARVNGANGSSGSARGSTQTTSSISAPAAIAPSTSTA